MASGRSKVLTSPSHTLAYAVLWLVPLLLIVIGHAEVWLSTWQSGAVTGAGTALLAFVVHTEFKYQTGGFDDSHESDGSEGGPTCPTCGTDLGGDGE